MKKKKLRVKHYDWGYGFAEHGAVNQCPFSVFYAEKEPVAVVIIPVKEVKKMCKALGIPFDPMIR